MLHNHGTKIAYKYPGDRRGSGDHAELTLPLRTVTRPGKLYCSTALVASPEKKVLQELAEIITRCGLSICLAFTFGEAKRILKRREVCLVVCDDGLLDGKYEDILNETNVPVIVVSPRGDWPDYLKAVGAGAFDYLAYPPIPGDLPRSVRNALARTQENPSKYFRSSKEECNER